MWALLGDSTLMSSLGVDPPLPGASVDLPWHVDSVPNGILPWVCSDPPHIFCWVASPPLWTLKLPTQVV